MHVQHLTFYAPAVTDITKFHPLYSVKVASRRVFQLTGVTLAVFGLMPKISMIFVTVPFAVLGGVQIVAIGNFLLNLNEYFAYTQP